MKRSLPTGREAKPSPLYTSKKEAAIKRAEVERMGRDLDGAYRVNGRIDGGAGKEAA